MDKSIEDVLLQIKNGNAAERERLIQQCRPFIIRSVCHVCKRQIGWHDDEASIGIIAFNEAIDRYNPVHGKSFENFSYVIIRSRLVDEFRKQGKILKTESLVWDGHDEFELAANEIAGSLEAYERGKSASELAEELIRYDEMLQEYGISLDELEDCSPDHKDARIQLIRIAKQFSMEPGFMAYLHRTKHLPIKDMLHHVEVSKKTIERNRKYLIALILIYSNDEFKRIRSTVSFAEIGE